MVQETFTESGEKIVTVEGSLERIIWQGNGRIIASVKPDNRSPLTVIGPLESPRLGQRYSFTGRWKWNDRYGKCDLAFNDFRTVLPDDANGIYHYLVNTAKWVGPETAKVLIERFGNKTLETLKRAPEMVAQAKIPGLTPERLKKVTDDLLNNEKQEQTLVDVGNLIGGVLQRSCIQKAVKKWGYKAAALIRRDPFRLMELPGVGFAQADAIRAACGKSTDNLRRHAHAMLHVLHDQAQSEGHTVLSDMNFTSSLKKLVDNPHAKAMPLLTRAHRVIQEDGLVADRDLADAERFIAAKLRRMLALGQQSQAESCAAEVPEELAEDQKKAFVLAMNNTVCAITGPPGTGKTFTIARILQAWQKANHTLALCAPTGKAAKQMELALAGSVTARPVTIHSLLEPEVDEETGEFHFTRDEDDPLPCTAMVVDETSMVDVRLMRSLLLAVPDSCRLLLVGDAYQLPSVGPGAVLRDIIRSKAIPHFELSKIKRNAGRIVIACHAIKDGRQPEPAAKLNLETGDNWRHIETADFDETREAIELLLRHKLAALGIDPVWQTQLISPTNERGRLSCKELNGLAKSIVNPLPPESGLSFAVNDKIVRTRNGKARLIEMSVCPQCQGEGEFNGEPCKPCNGVGRMEGNAEVRIVNGDIGVIQAIEKSHIIANFMYPSRTVKLSRKDHELRLAYCMTCHKMQGSECDVVILPVAKSLMGIPMVTREWLYTAISRAKKFILTIGQLEEIGSPLARIGNIKRQTTLADWLGGKAA